jgi:hypothetical protein
MKITVRRGITVLSTAIVRIGTTLQPRLSSPPTPLAPA